MPDVSLITSLYKTEQFLPRYVEAAKKLAREVKRAGLDLEFVIIPNDASDEERRLLTGLDKFLVAEQIATLQIHYVALETLYATWNRGVKAATGKVVGIWNVDDTRTMRGIVEAHQLIVEQGYDLVDFPVHYVITENILGLEHIIQKDAPPQYNPAQIHPKNCTGPFFMMNPVVYERAGEFDPNFRVSGEFEWCMRDAVRQSKIGYGEQIAGTFYLHGNNITQSSGSLEWIVYNISLLRHQVYDSLYPVDPVQMRELWEAWGDTGVPVPDHAKEFLWGEGAQERYERYRMERKLPSFVRRIMLALAKRGLIYSADWEVHHGKSSTG